MATAKQIAARKLFAERARSGSFKRKAATARKKAAPAKNPKSRSYAGKYPNRICQVSASNGVAHVITNGGEKHVFHARDVGGEMPRVGDDISIWLHAAEGKHAPRRPLSRSKTGVVKRNPAKPVVDYKVYHANSHGEPGKLIASFPVKADAVTYAKEYARKHRVPVVIVGKGVSS